ncbi:MAG TPA: hypothetical protein VFC31_00910 [Candidatus Limnocylindria bacterium]|nr:hypothetical protein [Candidatus Limnocylindria bacterium]
MSERARPHRRPPVQGERRVRFFVVGSIALAILGVGAWLLTADASPLRGASAPSGAASLASYRPADLHALVVSPSDERTITFGHHNGMLVSHDGGATWKALSGTAGKDAMGMAMPPHSDVAYVAGHDMAMRSDDGGRSWSSTRLALPGTDIHGFAASASEPNTFYAFVVGAGLFESRDAGATWSGIGQAPSSMMSLAAARSISGDVLLASTMEGMARSRDGGRGWESLREVPAGAVSAVDEMVFVSDRGALIASMDGGLTWQRRAFPRNAGLVAIAPSNTRVVYVVTDRLEIWRSSDGGASWERAG